MKNPKRPTREQKILMSSKGLNPEEYLVVADKENHLTVVSKTKNEKDEFVVRTIDKPEQPERRSRRWKQ